MASRVAIDWDGTLVDGKTQEWLPGARTAIVQLRAKGYEPFIHTCRANWPEGLASIEAKLAAERLTIDVVAKPLADFYVDDRSVPFTDWATVNQLIPPTPKALRTVT